MARVAISAKPNTKVTGLSIKRTNNSFKATWKVPSGSTKESDAKRWTGVHVEIYAKVWKTVNGKKQSVKAYSQSHDYSIATTSCTLSLTTANINALFPKKANGPLLLSVTCDVYARNSKGRGKPASTTYKMAVPAKPALDLTFDAQTNKVTAHLTAVNETSSTRQRTDSVLTVRRAGTIETNGKKLLLDNSDSASTDRTWSYVIPNADALTVGQYVRVTATARNRGLRGNGDNVSKTIYIAHPTVPTCKTPVIKWATNGVLSTASVLVPVGASGRVAVKNADGDDASAWPETLYLHRLKNSLATTPTEAASAEGWANVDGAEATGTCTGLMDTWADGVSDAGKRTWYRIVAEKDGYTQYGVPIFADCIYVPDTSGGSGDATIGNIVSGADGKSIIVPVTWTQASNDGVELSWSIYEDAWQSNEKPSTLDVDWGSNQSATATIRGLDTGVPVFVKARCYDIDSEGEKTYSGYSAAKMAIPYDAPEEVTATAPAAVVAGGEIPVEWTFDSDSPQQWADVLIDGVPTVAEDSEGHTVTGSAGATSISTEGLSLGSHTVAVTVSTDGVSGVTSRTVAVIVANAPTGTIAVTGTTDSEQGSQTYGLLVVDAQPVEVILSTTTSSPSVVIAVIADGCSADEMHDAQADGEVVWSGSFTGSQLTPPSDSTSYALTQDESVVDGKTYYQLVSGEYVVVENPQDSGLSGYYEYTGTAWSIKLPTGLDIRDTCGYSVRCTLVDGATGLSSALAAASFAVKWAHQAVEPEGSVSVSDLSAIITVPAPTGADQTDVIDLYRVTPGGQYLIASGRELGSQIVDDYAPFRSRRSDTELRYRAVLRTVDGDMEFSDLYYDLICGSLRLDWGSNSVELPYNINRSDSFAKDSALRKHADGSIGGYWSPSVEHRGSLSTDLVKIESAEKREALIDMANWPGPVFVRTPDGMAYCADANLGSIELSYSSMAVSVSIDASEIALVDAFTAVPVTEGGGS